MKYFYAQNRFRMRTLGRICVRLPVASSKHLFPRCWPIRYRSPRVIKMPRVRAVDMKSRFWTEFARGRFNAPSQIRRRHNASSTEPSVVELKSRLDGGRAWSWLTVQLANIAIPPRLLLSDRNYERCIVNESRINVGKCTWHKINDRIPERLRKREMWINMWLLDYYLLNQKSELVIGKIKYIFFISIDLFFSSRNIPGYAIFFKKKYSLNISENILKSLSFHSHQRARYFIRCTVFSHRGRSRNSRGCVSTEDQP